MVLNWGICCAGLISHDFVSAFCEFQNSSIEIKAIAARNEERAKQFAEKYKIVNYFDSYEKLAQCDDVDIVYIGSIDSEHCQLAKLFLNHGKHVLVEKPMATSVEKTKEMINLAREKQLFLMEGIWSRCFPLYKEIRNSVLNGTIGLLRHVNANFQIDIGTLNKELDSGGLHAIGIYVLQFALWIFHGRKCIKATSDLKFKNGFDAFGTILLEFENNGTAFLNYHTGVNGDTSASVYGDLGSIVIPTTMWSPEEFVINGKLDQSLKIERKDESFKYTFKNSWYFIHEINHVSQCIENGFTESDIHPLDASLEIAELMEKLLEK